MKMTRSGVSAERRPSRVLKRQEKAKRLRIKRALLCVDRAYALTVLRDDGFSQADAVAAYEKARQG